MRQLIANYWLRNDLNCSHYIKLYSDGTTLEVLDELINDCDEDLDASCGETEGTYKNSFYKQQLKNLVMQNYRNCKLKDLPVWL